MTLKDEKLIIFDCDGVLVDSEIIANRIDAEVLTEYGYALSTEESIKKFTGMNSKTVREYIFQETGLVIPDAHSDITQMCVLKAFEEELESLMGDVLSHSAVAKFKKCIASSSSRERVIKSLELTDLDGFFSKNCIFSSSQVKKGKPFPDLFLFAAQKMQVSPENCLVIEDSIAGIKAAQSAGMAVIAFLGGRHADFDWYQDNIKALNVPIALTCGEILSHLESFVEF